MVFMLVSGRVAWFGLQVQLCVSFVRLVMAIGGVICSDYYNTVVQRTLHIVLPQSYPAVTSMAVLLTADLAVSPFAPPQLTTRQTPAKPGPFPRPQSSRSCPPPHRPERNTSRDPAQAIRGCGREGSRTYVVQRLCKNYTMVLPQLVKAASGDSWDGLLEKVDGRRH